MGYIYIAFPKSRKSIFAWISISYGILPILIFGVLFVLISRTASAGAVLVGCTIISQALLQVWPLLGRIGGRKSKAQVVIEVLNPEILGIRCESGLNSAKVQKRLKTIALKDELNFQHPNRKFGWVQKLTVSRSYLSLEYCIVICAVLGTLVWAYGSVQGSC